MVVALRVWFVLIVIPGTPSVLVGFGSSEPFRARWLDDCSVSSSRRAAVEQH
jgi:hypothetical protein